MQSLFLMLERLLNNRLKNGEDPNFLAQQKAMLLQANDGKSGNYFVFFKFPLPPAPLSYPQLSHYVQAWVFQQQQVKILDTTFEIKPPEASLCIFSRQDHSFDFLALNKEETEQLCKELEVANLRPRSGTSDDINRPPLDSSEWDALKIYKPYVATFYQEKHKVLSQYLLLKIEKQASASSTIILDLGCGTGKLFETFTQQSQGRIPFLWLGVDKSAENIRLAKASFGLPHCAWIESDALNFIENIDNFIPETWKTTWHTAKIWVVSSGLITLQVLTFKEAIKLLHALKFLAINRKLQFQKLLLTGLSEMWASPYILKQMGFKLINKYSKQFNLFCVESMEFSEEVNTVKKRIERYNCLDLSYRPELSLWIEKLLHEPDIFWNKVKYVMCDFFGTLEALDEKAVLALEKLFERLSGATLLLRDAQLFQNFSIWPLLEKSILHASIQSNFLYARFPLSPHFFRKVCESYQDDISRKNEKETGTEKTLLHTFQERSGTDFATPSSRIPSISKPSHSPGNFSWESPESKELWDVVDDYTNKLWGP